MENMILISIPRDEFKELVRDEVKSALREQTSQKTFGPFLSVEELATVTHLSRQTIYQKLSAGKIPGVRKLDNGKVIFDTDVIYEWINSSAILSKGEMLEAVRNHAVIRPGVGKVDNSKA